MGKPLYLLIGHTDQISNLQPLYWKVKSFFFFFLVIQNSIIFLLPNHNTVVLSNSYIITMVKDVCQVSQSIARQKNKKIAGVVTTAPSGKPQGKPPFKALEYESSIQ